jgi:hypothetical protein
MRLQVRFWPSLGWSLSVSCSMGDQEGQPHQMTAQMNPATRASRGARRSGPVLMGVRVTRGNVNEAGTLTLRARCRPLGCSPGVGPRSPTRPRGDRETLRPFRKGDFRNYLAAGDTFGSPEPKLQFSSVSVFGKYTRRRRSLLDDHPGIATRSQGATGAPGEKALPAHASGRRQPARHVATAYLSHGAGNLEPTAFTSSPTTPSAWLAPRPLARPSLAGPRRRPHYIAPQSDGEVPPPTATTAPLDQPRDC